MKPGKIARLLFGLLLAAFFVWLLVAQVRWTELRHAFAQTSLSWVLAGLLVFFVGYAGRIERWRLMLSLDNPQISWRQCAGPFLASFAANNVLPFRVGDLLRTVAFNQSLGVSAGTVLATVLVERLLDFLVVLVFLGIVFYWFRSEVGALIGVGYTAGVLLLWAAVLGILLFLSRPQWVAPVLLKTGSLVARWLP